MQGRGRNNRLQGGDRKSSARTRDYPLDEHALAMFGDRAPMWMEDLKADYARVFLPDHRDETPTVALVPLPSNQRFGGRHMPEENAILLYDTGHDPMTMAVELHELTHWARKRLGDPRGRHDNAFGAMLERVFRHYEVSSKIARTIEQICDEEDSYCYRWRW